jgi:hypothetical protein
MLFIDDVIIPKLLNKLLLFCILKLSNFIFFKTALDIFENNPPFVEYRFFNAYPFPSRLLAKSCGSQPFPSL